MDQLLLASASPRRKEILSSLGIAFQIAPADLDESLRDYLPPPERVIALAEDKARAAASRARADSPRWVLGADTLVCMSATGQLPEYVLGKPQDREEARSMLRALSGRTHCVHTGLVLLDRASGRFERARSDSFVRFAALLGAEIETYLDSREWEGAAGGYRIQGRAALYIENIEGSWSGIVGLPIRELYVILQKFGLTTTFNRGGRF